jgi:DNA polymerase-1
MMANDNGAKRLFLFDGMALVYRAHFALIRSPRYTSGGLCTSAVFGVANTLLDIFNRERPTHVAVVFDTFEATHRHQAFPEYKATRDHAPEDLSAQFPLVDRLFEAFRIPAIRVPGFEADDVIASLACRAEREGFETWMVTPDKDLQQLVTEKILVYKPGRFGGEPEKMGVAEVLDRWKIERVSQVIDVLALMGDTVDNVPGIPGVGEKTAQKLIADFGTVEELVTHTDRLKGKQKQLVETHREQALLSKKLVTVVCDVPNDVDLDALAQQPWDEPALKSLFVELEFDVMGKRLFGQSFSASPALGGRATGSREAEIQAAVLGDDVVERTIREVPHTYGIVRTPEERASLIASLRTQSAIAINAKTSEIDPRDAIPPGIAFSFEPGTAHYVVIPSDQTEALAVLREFRDVFEDSEIEKIGHDLKHEAELLRWNEMELRGALFDVALAHAMKDPEMRTGLDYLSKLYLRYIPVPLIELIGPPGDDQKKLSDVPLEQLAEYVSEATDVTLQVSRAMRPEIESRGVAQVCYQVECPLIPALVEMEYHGIRMDAAALHTYGHQLDAEIDQLRAAIFAVAGREFNIDSPKQLAEVLYEDLKLVEKPKKTATGQFSTRETELMRLAGEHKIVRDVLEYRNAVKLKSNYVDVLPAYVHPKTGRLHTHYLQSWAATGRMQSNDPNLQTIPVRKERGREIRAAFIPRDDDYLLLAADYSQIELRIMADLSGDEAMRDAFANDIDIHTATASNVFHVPLDAVTREMRDKSKAVNFGIIYGISAFGLQQRLNIPREEAKSLIDTYFEKHPRVRAYIDETIALAKSQGYVTTRTGRRRYLRDINSSNFTVRSAAERLAMNSPIQGTAADLLKLAVIRVHQALRRGEFKTKMLLTVHDEILFDMHRSEQERVMPVIEEAMKGALPMAVPVVVEMGVGANWLEAH